MNHVTKTEGNKTKIFDGIIKKQSIIVRLITQSDCEEQFKNSQTTS